MNEKAFTDIKTLLNAAGVIYNVYIHPECRTSEESARVRKEAGMPDAVGAKALLCKVDFKGGSEFVVFVLPGTHTLNKTKIKIGLPDIKKFRFSTKEELMDIASVVPGCMPPFGSQIFSKASKLYVSSALKDFPRVAFNAAKLDTSITLAAEDYFRAIKPDLVFDLSSSKEKTL